VLAGPQEEKFVELRLGRLSKSILTSFSSVLSGRQHTLDCHGYFRYSSTLFFLVRELIFPRGTHQKAAEKTRKYLSSSGLSQYHNRVGGKLRKLAVVVWASYSLLVLLLHRIKARGFGMQL
jgi:hypothetical protein